MKGTVFDIKEFSVHDGPGARVTVFLKGCPLRCKWCHNPEGFSKAPEIMWKKTLCSGCGLCRKPCDHEECHPFGRCIKRCVYGALSVSGREWEAEDLIRKLDRYRTILALSEGGITFSGGEPLFQPEFLLEVLNGLREKKIHTAIETSGYAAEEVFRNVLDRTDFVMMDIKLADSGMHRYYTGVDNAPILRNLAILRESGKPHLFRVPLIPGITDTEENLRSIAGLSGDSAVELLEYNMFAPMKYEMMNKKYPLTELPERRTPDLSCFQNAVLSKL